MENLFGELPLVKFLLAFAIVFILIVATFWLLRRFGGTRIGGASRGRQPRLAVIDAAAVDGRRRLVLIRRDNVEHLVMIGGPSDVVIEQNIVRAVPVAPAREAAAARPPGAPEPRVETPAPTPAEPALRAPRPAAALDEAWPAGEPPLRPRPETTWAAPSEPSFRPQRPVPPPDDARPPVQEPRAPRAEPTLRNAPAPRVEPPARSEPPRGERREPTLRPPASEVPPPPVPPPATEKPGAEPATVARTPPLAPDANLADMAQRLEAALRRPIRPSAERTPEGGAKAAPTVEPSARPAPPTAAPTPAENEPADKEADKETARTPTPRAPTTESKPASPKSVLDSLEEEMASLLGRPAGKE